jgi:hypothetical protein
MRWAELRIAEQAIPVLVLLCLVLLNLGKTLCSLILPLLVLVERLLDGCRAFFDASQTGMDFSSLHLMFTVTWSEERCTSQLEMGASRRRYFWCINRVATTSLTVMVKVTLFPLATCSLLPGTIRVLRWSLLPWAVCGWETLRRSCTVKGLVGSVGVDGSYLPFEIVNQTWIRA